MLASLTAQFQLPAETCPCLRLACRVCIVTTEELRFANGPLCVLWAQVVTSPTPWTGGLVAISSFGFGGSNVHAIIDGRVRPKGPPPRPLPKPETVENQEEAVGKGATVIQEIQEEDPLFPPEARPLTRSTSHWHQKIRHMHDRHEAHAFSVTCARLVFLVWAHSKLMQWGCQRR